ncbi:MAG: bifunctional alpha/beta hydrolase/OsmC family protein [Pseudomonadota bacterium]
MAERSLKVTFTGSLGEELAGRLELPAGIPQAYALFAHCFSCSKDVTAAVRISEALSDRGIAVLRFDFTGLGNSQGDFANTTFSSNVGDLVRAADYLRDQYQAPSILIGHSLGGAAVLSAASEVPECTAVATIGAPADPEHVSHLFDSAKDEIVEKGEAEVDLAGRTFRIKKEFLDDLASQRQAQKIKNLKRALMVFHSPVDEIVGIENARDIYETAHHPKSFVSLDTANHLLTKREDSRFVARVLSAWAARYVENEEVQAWPKPVDQKVVVREVGTSKFANHVTAGPHRLTADEPAPYGGTDTGPTPYDYLLTALGTCTSMTIRMYAEHKKIPLEQVTVTLGHQKIHAQDCEECETREGRIDHITREISFKGDLTDEQKAKMMEIADKCPVHRTLHGEIKIDKEMV